MGVRYLRETAKLVDAGRMKPIRTATISIR